MSTLKECKSTDEYFLESIRQCIENVRRCSNKDDVLFQLSLEQDFAIKLGTMIENRVEQDTQAVRLLEELCELIYQSGEGFGSTDFDRMIDSMSDMINQVECLIKELNLRREVVILPYRYEYCGEVRSLYNMCSDCKDTDVYVVPIPYYDKMPDGELAERYYEGSMFEREFEITGYGDYKIEERFPDIIIVQNVQENSGYALSVAPDYYVENLRTFTGNLIYVSPFEIDNVDGGDERGAYSLKFFVTVPGMVYVDKVVVHSAEERKVYIKALTEFLGEETGTMWENIVTTKDRLSAACTGHSIDNLESVWEESSASKQLTCAGKNTSSETDADEIMQITPGYWRDYIIDVSGKRKKVILFRISISTFLQHKEKAVEKLVNIMDVFSQNQKDIVIIWKPDQSMEKMREYEPELWKKYCELVDRYRSSGIGIYDADAEDNSVGIADAYYGDPCVEASMVRRRGKPVMIMNVVV